METRVIRLVKTLAAGAIMVIAVVMVLSLGRRMFESELLALALDRPSSVSIDEVDMWGRRYDGDDIPTGAILHASLNRRMIRLLWPAIQDAVPQLTGYGRVGKDFVSRHAEGSGMTGTEAIGRYGLDEGLITQTAIRFQDAAEGAQDREVTKNVLYAGPEGISEVPAESLGRFGDVLWRPSYDGDVIGLDRWRRAFFRIDFEGRRVDWGPPVQDDSFQPIQIGRIARNDFALNVWWETPSEAHASATPRAAGANEATSSAPAMGHYDSPVRLQWEAEDVVLILDRSGTIWKLDRAALAVVGKAGETPFLKPHDLLAYDVRVAVGEAASYQGMAVASLARAGAGILLFTYDNDGWRLEGDSYAMTPGSVPGGYTLLIGKAIVENLYPLVLAAGSFAEGYRCDAVSSLHGVFMIPSSAFASRGRIFAERSSLKVRFFALLILIPPMGLGAVLGWRVARDAKQRGLPPGSRKAWFVATVMLGLAGYITWRLVRPGEVMVTCSECGRLRRTELAVCQHCGASWQASAPLAWRVVEGVETEDAAVGQDAGQPATM